jgi:hypothetical protein
MTQLHNQNKKQTALIVSNDTALHQNSYKVKYNFNTNTWHSILWAITVSKYKICFQTVISFLNMSTSRLTVFAALVHLAEGQILYVT